MLPCTRPHCQAGVRQDTYMSTTYMYVPAPHPSVSNCIVPCGLRHNLWQCTPPNQGHAVRKDDCNLTAWMVSQLPLDIAV